MASATTETDLIPLSKEAKKIQQLVLQSLTKRKIVGYNRDFLDSYRPNETQYLTDGEPEPFRLKHRESLREVVGTIVRSRYTRSEALRHLEEWSAENIIDEERAEFIEVGEEEILGLHEGNFARYRLPPSEFEAWRKIWN